MNGTNLDIYLQQANWAAVNEARGLGEAALPIVEKYSKDDDYQKRQIAMECAAVIGGEAASAILNAGLKDENLGVNLTTAHSLKDHPNPGVTETVVELLNENQEEVYRAALALAAGGLPGESTVEILTKIAAGDEPTVSENAQMALAKLGGGQAKQAIVAKLSDPLPRVRYEALRKLIYIDDQRLASYAIGLLNDKERALRIGLISDPIYRRVCDQAVDTLVALLKLSVSFQVSQEKIYQDAEITEVADRTR